MQNENAFDRGFGRAQTAVTLEMIDDGSPTLGRWAALALALLYLVGAFNSGLVAGVEMLLFCLVILACIWFPETMGENAGMVFGVNQASPGGFVWVLGWIVLLLPLIILAILILEGVHLSDLRFLRLEP